MLSSMKRPTFTYQSLCPWPDLPWAWSSRASSARHPSSQVDSIFTALCHPCSLLALSRPRPPTPLRLNGTPRIHLDVLYIWRLFLGSKHISDIVLAPNGIRPGLVYCLAWSRRQLQLYMLRHLPSASSGAFSISWGGVPPKRTGLLSSQDCNPGAIVDAAHAPADSLASSASSEFVWCLSTTSLSFSVAWSSDRDMFGLLWLGRATQSSRPESPNPGGGCR